MRSKDKDLDLKNLVHLEERVEYERGWGKENRNISMEQN